MQAANGKRNNHTASVKRIDIILMMASKKHVAIRLVFGAMSWPTITTLTESRGVETNARKTYSRGGNLSCRMEWHGRNSDGDDTYHHDKYY